MKIKVAIVVSEAVPFAKTGGLADVAGALPKSLGKVGADVTLIMPYYKEVAAGGFGEKKIGKIHVPVGVTNIGVQVYRTDIPNTKAAVYFLGYDQFYNRDGLYQEKGIDYSDNAERFILLCRGALELIIHEDLRPDVIHAHDWQAGLVPIYLKKFYRDRLPRTATVFTIHNVGYQGNFDRKYFPLTNLGWEHFSINELEFFGQFSFMKAGIVHADCITTVSERYAEEIQTPEFGFGMDGVLRQRKNDLYGVLNGIDYNVWNPAKDRLLPHNYGPDNIKGKQLCKAALEKELKFETGSKVALAGVISRLADQKGCDIIVEAIDGLLRLPCRYVLLGTGDLKYHRFFEEVAKRHPKRFAVRLGFDDALAHRIYAGADMFLMPSRYEPCGLGQMIAMAYGTIPVVRATGGLADTVVDADDKRRDGVGFTFERYSSSAFVETLERALSAYAKPRRWSALVKKAMKKDFSWEKQAGKYMDIFVKAIAKVKEKKNPE